MILIYRLIFVPILILMTVFLAALGHKKTKEGLRLRLKSNYKPPSSKDKVWIHASSGEFEYAKSLIISIKEKHPELEILVTYFSPSYASKIAQFPGVDLCIPLPLDTPSACRSFLNHYKPSLLLIARTDLWPEMLHQCYLKKIPSLLFSATGKKINFISKFYKKFQTKHIQKIYCVSDDDKKWIEAYYKGPIQTIGDTRYDQVAHRLNKPSTLNFDFSCAEKIITLGSTWPEDEQQLIPAFESTPHLKFIIAPHEPTDEHIDSLKEQLKAHNISYQVYSHTQKWESQALILDTTGLLADIYRFSTVAFIGGSFKKKVHSVMEALGAGNLVFIGPKNKNNREAQVFKAYELISPQLDTPPNLQLNAVTEALDSAHISAFLEKVQQSEIDHRPLIKEHFIEHLGATQKLISEVFS